MNFSFINVGIADYSVSASPDVLRTILGSCVGICFYDKEKRVGGLCHIMLPTYKDSTSSKKKYADTAIPMILDDIVKIGGDRNRITAKIVGGARMFQAADSGILGEIGINNILKVREILKSLNITIIAEDTGGNYGRTIDFYLESGDIKIRSLSKDEKTI